MLRHTTTLEVRRIFFVVEVADETWVIKLLDSLNLAPSLLFELFWLRYASLVDEFDGVAVSLLVLPHLNLCTVTNTKGLSQQIVIHR